jgi:hypothetical protein
MTITFRDMLDQVRQATDASEGEYDNEEIVRELIEAHGLVNIDEIETNAFWRTVLDNEVGARV